MPEIVPTKEIGGFHNENHIINIGKKLNDLCGVFVREEALCLLQKVVDCNSQMCAEDRCGKAFALKNTLRDFELGKRGV